MTEYCCSALKKIVEKWDRPLYWPVYITDDLHDLRADRLAMAVYDLTPGGSISKKNRGAIAIKFCPFCGTNLT
jgi:hypothetical protein